MHERDGAGGFGRVCVGWIPIRNIYTGNLPAHGRWRLPSWKTERGVSRYVEETVTIRIFRSSTCEVPVGFKKKFFCFLVFVRSMRRFALTTARILPYKFTCRLLFVRWPTTFSELSMEYELCDKVYMHSRHIVSKELSTGSRIEYLPLENGKK